MVEKYFQEIANVFNAELSIKWQSKYLCRFYMKNTMIRVFLLLFLLLKKSDVLQDHKTIFLLSGYCRQVPRGQRLLLSVVSHCWSWHTVTNTESASLKINQEMSHIRVAHLTGSHSLGRVPNMQISLGIIQFTLCAWSLWNTTFFSRTSSEGMRTPPPPHLHT